MKYRHYSSQVNSDEIICQACKMVIYGNKASAEIKTACIFSQALWFIHHLFIVFVMISYHFFMHKDNLLVILNDVRLNNDVRLPSLKPFTSNYEALKGAAVTVNTNRWTVCRQWQMLLLRRRNSFSNELRQSRKLSITRAAILTHKSPPSS